MAVAKNVNDKYSNQLSVTIDQSAADALTFEEIDIGLTVFDKVGLLLQRMQVEINSTTRDNLLTTADVFEVALTQSNSIPTLNMQNAAVIDKIKISMALITSGALPLIQPLTRDWSNLGGGGILIVPRPFYIAINSTGFAAAGQATCRLFFQVVTLKPEEYFELLETRQYFG